MRFRRARFKNFRMLRDLELDFSTDDERPLTVIRSENESGKSTVLMALQWCLYGERALPDGGKSYRLHPIGWDLNTESGPLVPIEVSIDFEVDSIRRSSGGQMQAEQRNYRALRTVHESVMGSNWSRPDKADFGLYELGEAGAEPVPVSRSLEEEFPSELRELLFADGDRALSFIEAEDPATKRGRVEEAIKSLLGLERLESAEGHIARTIRGANLRIKERSEGDLAVVSKDLEGVLDQLARQEQEEKEALAQNEQISIRIEEMNRTFATALSSDHEALNQRKLDIERRRKDLAKNRLAAAQEHVDLIASDVLATALIGPATASVVSKVGDLVRDGDLPHQVLPALERKLNDGVCFCGARLDEQDIDGHLRRETIEGLISQSRDTSDVGQAIIALHYQMGHESAASAAQQWVQASDAVVARRDQMLDDNAKLDTEMTQLDGELAGIGDANVGKLRADLAELGKTRDGAIARQTSAGEARKSLQRREGELRIQQRRLAESAKGVRQATAELTVAEDVRSVLAAARRHMVDVEITAVSDRMSRLFGDMILADPQPRAIIKSAAITSQYDICAYGDVEQTVLLDPGRDLNGASRRALTLAFILALIHVSGARAPNFIDSPLGSMSGHVKRAVLRTVVQESSQIVLFLTRSEIRDCEDILGEFVGVSTTLTNPMHYPAMLLNDPGVSLFNILRCDCNYESSCPRCERRANFGVSSDEEAP